MSNSMALFIALGLTGQRAVSAGLRETGRDGSNAARQMGSAWQTAGRHISEVGRIARNTAAMVGGTALIKSVITDVAEFERGLTEMRLTGELTAGEMGNIRKELLAMARADLQLPEDQLAAFQKMTAAGINPKVAIRGMHDLNMTATATFSNVVDIAQTSIDLFQKMGIAPEKFGRSLDMIAKGGKLGKFELKDMAQYIPTVASDMQRFGIAGEKGVAQMTAMLQIARRGTALPSEAATNMQNFFGHITQYGKDFKKLGINIYDFFDMKTGRVKAGKDIDDFFKEIIKKSGGSMMKLEQAGIRDMQAKAFIGRMMQDWEDRIENGELVKGYKSIRDESRNSTGTVAKDFKVVREETTWGKLKEAEIAKSEAMKSDKASSLAGGAANLLKMAVDNPVASIGLGVGAFGLYKYGKGSIAKRMGSGGGGIPGAGGGLSGGGAPLPVYVVNKHLSMLPGKGGWGFPDKVPDLPGGTGPAGKVAGRLGKFAKLAGGLAMGAPLETVAVGMAAYQAGSWFEKKYIKGAIGEALYDLLHQSEQKKAEQKNEINLSLQLDSQGRIVSRSDSMNTSINTVKRGSFFDAMTTVSGMGY